MSSASADELVEKKESYARRHNRETRYFVSVGHHYGRRTKPDAGTELADRRTREHRLFEPSAYCAEWDGACCPAMDGKRPNARRSKHHDLLRASGRRCCQSDFLFRKDVCHFRHELFRDRQRYRRRLNNPTRLHGKRKSGGAALKYSGCITASHPSRCHEYRWRGFRQCSSLGQTFR